MPITFRGPAHRVQLSWRCEHSAQPIHSNAGHTVVITVRTLPQAAHQSTPFIRGDVHYSGRDADAAWAAVRRVAPLAPLPKRLERLVTHAVLLRNCAACGLPIESGQGRTVLREGPRGGRWLHGPCATS
jgi:hypothetical protein